MRLLEARGIRKKFGAVTVLDGIDLDLDEHEVVCLIGASGSGKSTLLRTIDLLEPIDAGTIGFAGREITAAGVNPDEVRRSIGIVFQGFNLFPHMSVIDNVTLAPRRVLGQSSATAEATARELLERIGLWDRRAEFPDRLSGGQRQRVAIARSLAMKPRLLLLDEITSALDPVLVGEVLSLVRELAEGGMTMLLATHEMGFARDVAHRICFPSRRANPRGGATGADPVAPGRTGDTVVSPTRHRRRTPVTGVWRVRIALLVCAVYFGGSLPAYKMAGETLGHRRRTRCGSRSRRPYWSRSRGGRSTRRAADGAACSLSAAGGSA